MSSNDIIKILLLFEKSICQFKNLFNIFATKHGGPTLLRCSDDLENLRTELSMVKAENKRLENISSELLDAAKNMACAGFVIAGSTGQG